MPAIATSETLRPFRPEDGSQLCAIFRSAVTRVASAAYSPEQITVWLAASNDIEAFTRRLEDGLTLVAEASGLPVAFGQLEPAHRIAMLYCAPTHGRRGIASALYQKLENIARAKGADFLETEASLIAKGFFETCGFELIAQETVVRSGIHLPRFRMRKLLAGALLEPPAPLPFLFKTSQA